MSSNPHPTYGFVVAANRLPVDRTVDESGDVTWSRSPGGLVTAMDSVMSGRDAAWVGWAGEAGDAPEPMILGTTYIKPVALSAEDVEDYYEGFSNDTLWPIYHDVIVPATFRRTWWARYQVVNQRFADAVCEVATEGATVWIHDYQLQLVPALVRAARPDVRIGWFNHIPFPSVELFAQLPWRNDILRGLLGADFLGFQRQADALNFLRSCRQLLHAQTRRDLVRMGGGGSASRWSRVAAVPISVDAAAMEQLARSPEVQARAAAIRASLGDPQVLMLGVDRLDYTKGIRHRLKAFEELLAEGRLAPPAVTLVQVATPSRERVDAYRELRTQVETTVGRINGLYAGIGTPAIHYLHHSYDQAEMAALYVAADVMLVTPLRDGMNLVAKEYVACRYDDGGALVLSEFTGAWNELKQAYVCNPHDIVGLKEAMMRAITEPAALRRRRMRALRRRVLSHDVQRWAGRFLDSLAAAPAAPARSARESDADLDADAPVGPPPEPSPLGGSLTDALAAVAQVDRLLVATDFDGTLAPFTLDPMESRAEPGALPALAWLAALDRTTVAVVSGRDIGTLSQLTGIPASGGGAGQPLLAGSHGAESSDPTLYSVAQIPGRAARVAALTDELTRVAQRHPGARVEVKTAGVSLHTRGMPEAAEDAALADALAVGAQHTDVRVVPGKSVVELSVSDADKGSAVVAIADAVGADAVVFFGDDPTDEDAFRMLHGPLDVTVKVGPGSTAAGYRVSGPPDVAAALAGLLDRRRGLAG